jgi:hypothetical protein
MITHNSLKLSSLHLRTWHLVYQNHLITVLASPVARDNPRPGATLHLQPKERSSGTDHWLQLVRPLATVNVEALLHVLGLFLQTASILPGEHRL